MDRQEEGDSGDSASVGNRFMGVYGEGEGFQLLMELDEAGVLCLGVPPSLPLYAREFAINPAIGGVKGGVV